MSNPYVVLGVRPSATKAQIKAAYRKRAKRFHPDHATGAVDPEKLAQKMAELNSAYEVLTAPKPRDNGEPAPPPRPANVTTYLRLLKESERLVLEREAKAVERRMKRERLFDRLKSPFGAPLVQREPITLTAIRIDTDGLQLNFDRKPSQEHILLLLPQLTYQPEHGSVRIATDTVKTIATSDAGDDKAVLVEDATPFVAGFDGPVRLQFEV